MRIAGLYFVLVLSAPAVLRAQDLEPADVRVTLDSALRVAHGAAAAAFPDLSRYLLYSVAPRVFKGDPGGLHWQVRWQARDFPHRRWLVVRVYMSDGHTTVGRETVPEPPATAP
jgi:hypothetical protein